DRSVARRRKRTQERTHDMGALDGKVALVTGAGRLRGIGRATAVALADMGADVVVTGTGRDLATYPDDEKKAGWRDVESTAEQIRGCGRRELTWTGDVSQSEAVSRLVDQIVKTFGRLDVLVNNAAYPRGKTGRRCPSWTRRSGGRCWRSSSRARSSSARR